MFKVKNPKHFNTLKWTFDLLTSCFVSRTFSMCSRQKFRRNWPWLFKMCIGETEYFKTFTRMNKMQIKYQDFCLPIFLLVQEISTPSAGKKKNLPCCFWASYSNLQANSTFGCRHRVAENHRDLTHCEVALQGTWNYWIVMNCRWLWLGW